MDSDVFTVRRIAELLNDLMARTDEHPQHGDDRGGDDGELDVGSDCDHPKNPEALEDLKVCRPMTASCEPNRGLYRPLSKAFPSWEAEEMSLHVEGKI